jgi:hypothetical protein
MIMKIELLNKIEDNLYESSRGYYYNNRLISKSIIEYVRYLNYFH